ncbi:MAG: hypothetical protein JNK15_15100 [Planctomycetes bacterium]|nr:hypothetical protein [Planctomycetota bacterium]
MGASANSSPRWLAVAVLATIPACATPMGRSLATERQHREELAARYPVGSAWSKPSERFGRWTRWAVAEPAPDAFALQALVDVRGRSPVAPVDCWHGDVPRWGSFTSLGPCGIWHDYVFVDADGRVLAAYRAFLD